MNLSELTHLLQWVQLEVFDKAVSQSYAGLVQHVGVQVNPNQTRTPYTELKNSLIDLLKGVPVDQLSSQQVKCLEQYKMNHLIGPEGARQLSQLFLDAGHDIAHLYQSLQERTNQLNASQAQLTQLKKDLEPMAEVAKALDPHKATLRVHFKDEAGMHNVEELKTWTEHWYFIGKGIAEAVGDTAVDIEVKGVSNGSVIVDFSVGFAVAKMTLTLIKQCLSVASETLDLYKKAKDIFGSTGDESLKESIEASADQLKEKKIDQLIEDNKANADQTALRQAVERLTKFLEKGGGAEIIPPTSPESETGDPETQKHITDMHGEIAEIRKLEHKLHLLEHADVPPQAELEEGPSDEE